MLNESNKTALTLVLHSMIYMPKDLYTEDLFSENFCAGFRAQFYDAYHQDIRDALDWAMQNPDYPFDELLPLLKRRYSKADIYYYLQQFHNRLKKC